MGSFALGRFWVEETENSLLGSRLHSGAVMTACTRPLGLYFWCVLSPEGALTGSPPEVKDWECFEDSKNTQRSRCSSSPWAREEKLWKCPGVAEWKKSTPSFWYFDPQALCLSGALLMSSPHAELPGTWREESRPQSPQPGRSCLSGAGVSLEGPLGFSWAPCAFWVPFS